MASMDKDAPLVYENGEPVKPGTEIQMDSFDYDDEPDDKRFGLFRFLVLYFIALAVITAIVFLFLRGIAGAETLGFRQPAGVASSTLSCGNALLLAQVADDVTTATIIRNGGYERDPLARPTARSLPLSLAGSFVLNYALRHVTAHRPQTLCAAAVAEVPFIANNLRAIGRQR